MCLKVKKRCKRVLTSNFKQQITLNLYVKCCLTIKTYYSDKLNTGSVLYKQKSLDEEAEVFIDPNKLSNDGTLSVRGTEFSKDGSLCAYTVCKNGSDWQVIKVISLLIKY